MADAVIEANQGEAADAEDLFTEEGAEEAVETADEEETTEE